MEEAAGAAESSGGEGQEGNEGLEGGQQAKGDKPKPKPVPKMRQVKVNGRVEYVNEDDVFRDYQKYRAGEEKMREVTQKESKIDDFYRKLAEDPDAVLRDPKLSLKRRDLALKWLEEEVTNDLNPPDPRDEENKKLKDRVKEFEDRDEEEKNKKKEEENQKFIESRKTAISTTLSEAMKATQLSGHPESAAATLREMAVYMRAAKQRGEDVTPQELVEHLHNSRFKQMYTLAHQYEGEELVQFLGEEIVNRIRKHDLERIRKRREGGAPVESYRSGDNRGASRNSGEQKFIDPNDERFALRAGR